jgi:hypothetical protein
MFVNIINNVLKLLQFTYLLMICLKKLSIMKRKTERCLMLNSLQQFLCLEPDQEIQGMYNLVSCHNRK